MKHKASKNEKGISLILTMLTLMIIFVIAFGVANLMLGQIKMAQEVPISLRAYYAAEVGIERKLYEMRKEEPPDTNNIGSPPDCTGGGAVCLNGSDVCYSVSVTTGTTTYIKSYGCHRRIKRSVEVSY